MRRKRLMIFFFCVLLSSFGNAMGGIAPHFSISNQDDVQTILRRLAKTNPEKVSFIVETQRWHLKNPRPEAISDKIRFQLQDAFYYEVELLCKSYGQKYLMNWEAIASKAARETFWGTSYLCNRALNYFGIRRTNKPWICDAFGYCQTVMRHDPTLSEFVVFPDFEASLWMFIHTAYSAHFLDRLPDYGLRVGGAIIYERQNDIHYWQTSIEGNNYAYQLHGNDYSLNEILYTWSGHAGNNLCEDCSVESDMKWVGKLRQTQARAKH